MEKIDFSEIRTILKEFGIKELPYYACSLLQKRNDCKINKIDANGKIEYNTSITQDNVDVFASRLRRYLPKARLITFTYRGRGEYHVLLMPDYENNNLDVLCGRFTDIGSSMHINFNHRNCNDYIVYCNFMISFEFNLHSTKQDLHIISEKFFNK